MLKFAKQFLAQPQAPREQPLDDSSIYDTPAPVEPDFVLRENASVIGKIAFQNSAVIHGLFEGEFEGGHSLHIGPQGFVKADIHVNEAEIAGKVEGNITVRHRLVLKGNAEIRGNITAPKISVDEGVSILGQVHVTSTNTTDLHTPF